jgi:sulfonate transport system permease protein
MKKITNRLKKSKIISVFSLLMFFIVWQIVCVQNQEMEYFNPKFLPSPTQIIITLKKYIVDGSLFVHISASMVRVGAGFLLGLTVAIVLGIIISQSKVCDLILTPILNFIGPIPVYAFLPIFIIWFGIGENSKILLIAFATFLPVLTYTLDGIRNVNPVLLRAAMSLGANQKQIFRKVIFKSALPNVFAGMKVSLGLTFGALVVAEMMGANKGLGYIIINAKQWFKMSDMFMAITLIGLLYSLFLFIIGLIEKRVFKWRMNGVQSAIESK